MTYRKALRLCKAFANNSLTNIKLSKTQLSVIIYSWGFLGRLIWPLLKVGLLWMENLLISLAESILIPLRLTAAAVADAGIQKKS